MKSINHLNFIIKYQLGLAIDFQKTVNNPEYKKIIDKYFELIDENSKLKQKRMIDEYIKKYQDEQIKRKRIYDYEDKKITNLNEKIKDHNQSDSFININSPSILAGGDFDEDIIEKTNNIGFTFLEIYEDILATNKDYKYRFFKENTLEYKNVEAFINSIKENNELVENKLKTIEKTEVDEYQSTAMCLVSLNIFNSFMARLSFYLPTLKPRSNLYKKILNYIYLCVVLFDEKIIKTSSEDNFINCSHLNNSIVPYGFGINEDDDLNMGVFQGSCAHISSLLSIALEEKNDQLLRDFMSKELCISFRKKIEVNNMNLHLLLSLSELLLNRGNLNFYTSYEIITYNKLQNEIVFYRSFDESDIKELLEKEKHLMKLSNYPTLINVTETSYSYEMDYTNRFFGKCSMIEMQLYRETDFDNDELVVKFYKSKIDVIKNPSTKEEEIGKIINLIGKVKELPCNVFNFMESFIFSIDNHMILMHIKEPLKGEYEIIDSNSTSYKECPTFNIKKIYSHSSIICKIDKSSLNNLEKVIKHNFPDKNINNFINTDNSFEIAPTTLFYGQLKTDLTPIRFSLNKRGNTKPKLDLIDIDNGIFYIGNGIWLDKNGVCLFLIDDELTPINIENDTTNSPLTFDQLVLSDYILIFNKSETREITLKYISLLLMPDSKTSGGLRQNKYLIIILIFITVIIIVAIIIKLIINKNKIINNQITSE